MSAVVRVERLGPVTTVIVDRPEARNAVDPAAAAAQHATFVSSERDPQAPAAVLWGAGGAFCSGFDLKHVAAAGGTDWLDALSFPGDGAPGAGNAGFGPRTQGAHPRAL